MRSMPPMGSIPPGIRHHGQRGDGRSQKRDVQQAKVDVFDEGHELLIIAEMPGARKEEIMVEISGSCLHIGTPLASLRPFWGKAELPCPVTESHRCYRNGILELHFAKGHDLDPATTPNPSGHPGRDPISLERALRR
jgi:HSP20 family molecular chaperone IbpA